MSEALSVADAIERVPGWSPATVSVEAELGGLTNRNYRVRHGEERFVLRLPDMHTPSIPLDRRTELQVLRRAAAAGLTPDVVFADDGENILVTRFIDAPVTSPADFEDDRFMEELAALLRRVHALTPLGRRFDAAAAARGYAATLSAKPALGGVAKKCLAVIEATPAFEEYSCCHNDVVAENLVRSESLILLDWEYAADNHPLFDLASPIAYHDLSRRRAMVLLSAYSGRSAPEDREQLAVMMRLFDALHWLWLAQRQVLRRDDYRNSHLDDRLQALSRRIS